MSTTEENKVNVPSNRRSKRSRFRTSRVPRPIIQAQEYDYLGNIHLASFRVILFYHASYQVILCHQGTFLVIL